MKILVFMFEGPTSNNKEKRYIATSPWYALGKNIFLNSSINMEIFILMFESPISKNKENINFAPSPPPGTPLAKKYFFELLGLILKY